MELNAITVGSAVIVLICVVGLLVTKLLKKSGDKQAPAAAVPEPQEEPKVQVLVFYGTQTGTAEGFAKEVSEKLRDECTLVSRIEDLADVGDEDDLNAKLLEAPLALFLCSTYGDGEPPDTCMRFFERLEEQTKDADAADLPLSSLKYSVFALGSTQYETYCSAGKALDKLLGELGGNRLQAVALGDDDEDIDADFNTWLEKMLEEVRTEFGASVVRKSTDGPSAPSAFDIDFLQGVAASDSDTARPKSGYDAKHPFKATMTVRSELHGAASERSCLHVEVDLRGSGLRYETGDHLGVYPENSDTVVHQVATRLDVDPAAVISVSDPKKPLKPGETLNPLGHAGPLTVYTALARYCDLLNPLKKTALAALAFHTADPAEAARLRLLASADGKEDYTSWIVDSYRSVHEVLLAFPSCKPPLGVFLCSVAPRLLPRFYSISSSSAEFPNTPSLTVAVVRGPTGTGRTHEGVCSTWLETLQVGAPLQLPVFVRSSGFRLPKRAHTPIVMIGPGTGLAPFRGFIRERTLLQGKGQALGIAYLFFGCRQAGADFIYEEELRSAEAAGALSALDVAFSREAGQPKQYVQHRLQAQGAQVLQVLTDPKAKAHLYVCGATQMAKDVHGVLMSLLQTLHGMSSSDADAFLHKLTADGRYSRDVW